MEILAWMLGGGVGMGVEGIGDGRNLRKMSLGDLKRTHHSNGKSRVQR
jgi:hypothetical protein